VHTQYWWRGFFRAEKSGYLAAACHPTHFGDFGGDTKFLQISLDPWPRPWYFAYQFNKFTSYPEWWRDWPDETRQPRLRWVPIPEEYAGIL
jgi:hypothetical protein